MESLLALPNCHLVAQLPEIRLVVDYKELPQIKNRYICYARSIFTTKGGEVKIVVTFHPDWGSPVREMYLREGAEGYIKERVSMIMAVYSTKFETLPLEDKRQWDVVLKP